MNNPYLEFFWGVRPLPLHLPCGENRNAISSGQADKPKDKGRFAPVLPESPDITDMRDFQ